jgi:hypothetical protein
MDAGSWSVACARLRNFDVEVPATKEVVQVEAADRDVHAFATGSLAASVTRIRGATPPEQLLATGCGRRRRQPSVGPVRGLHAAWRSRTKGRRSKRSAGSALRSWRLDPFLRRDTHSLWPHVHRGGPRTWTPGSTRLRRLAPREPHERRRRWRTADRPYGAGGAPVDAEDEHGISTWPASSSAARRKRSRRLLGDGQAHVIRQVAAPAENK